MIPCRTLVLAQQYSIAVNKFLGNHETQGLVMICDSNIIESNVDLSVRQSVTTSLRTHDINFNSRVLL